MCRVDEAEGGEALLGRLRRKCADTGERVEDRREEQPLVDRTNRRLMVAVLRFEGLERGRVRRVAVAQHARDPSARARVGGERVRLLLLPELKAVLDRAQEDVCLGQASRVGILDVPLARELRQRLEGVAAPDCLVMTAMDELEQLHRELDIADAAAPALELTVVETTSRHLGFGTGLHGARLAHRVGVELVAPHKAAAQRHELLAERQIAGDGSRLDECLELPRPCPSLVPGLVALEVARQRAARPSGRRSASVRNTMPSAVGVRIASSNERATRSASALSPSCTNSTSTSLA